MSTLTSPSKNYRSLEIHVQRVNQLPPGNFYLAVTVDERREKTEISKTGVWNKQLRFAATNASMVIFELYQKRMVGKKSIGKFEVVLESLFDAGANGQSIRRVFQNSSPLILEFSINLTGIEGVPSAVSNIDPPSVGKQWGKVIARLDLLVRISKSVSEVNPVAKMAVSLFRNAYDVIRSQIDCDEKIGRLMEAILEACQFLDDSTETMERLHESAGQHRFVAQLVRQIIECYHFVDCYARKKFVTRVLENVTMDIDAIVTDYVQKLTEFKNAWSTRALAHLEITTHRLVDIVQRQIGLVWLGELPYSGSAHCDSTKGCLPLTRTSILTEIDQWIHQPGEDVPRVFVLYGGAGTGKSTIANSVAKAYDDIGRLGSSFRFLRGDATRHSHFLFPTISRDLADRDAAFRQTLDDTVGAELRLRQSHVVSEQFLNLILKPIEKLRLVGPLVFVIDALDECDSENLRRVAEVFSKNASKLPTNIRILITCRPDKPLPHLLKDGAYVRAKSMEDDKDITRSTSDDIRTLVEYQLKECNEATDGIVNRIVDAAGELFLFASIVCSTLLDANGIALGDLLDQLLTGSSRVKGLHGMYETILARLFNVHNEIVVENVRFVMGLILTVKEPLSQSALIKLCGHNARMAANIPRVTNCLPMLLIGVTDSTTPIRPIHTSFRDFLESPRTPFQVDSASSHRELLYGTLSLLRQQLKFNMCNIPTSHKLNKDIEGLTDSVNSYFDPPLLYACTSWEYHLGHSRAPDEKITAAVDSFLRKSVLFWFEALSLVGSVGLAAKMLSGVAIWAQNHGAQQTRLFAQDSHKFVRTFATIISQAAAHIYVSALQFAPTESLVRCAFQGDPQTLRGRPYRVILHDTRWWKTEQIFKHFEGVDCVAFSSDGRRVVSGSLDKTVRIWDAETGLETLAPLEGHSDRVASVAFSSDGRRVVSGSLDKTVRIWDAETGLETVAPLEGHSDAVKSVAFSSDGRRVVSGSLDKTVRIWDAEIGLETLAPLEGHSEGVNSVAFSSDGRRVVSGSLDKTVRIWDAEKGLETVAPLAGHSDAVGSAVFSSDGKRVVSGSWDNTLRIWDAETGLEIVAPLEGHSQPVNSVAFSSDGRRVVSGSWDKTVRIWDAEKGLETVAPLEGHSNTVTSVAFSPEGRRVVSGSWDNTVRIWDAETGLGTVAPLEGHSDAVGSVVFSSDGRRVVSGSWDKTVRIWDTETGSETVAPLEGHSDRVTSVAFSSDGRRVVSGSLDKTVRIWDAETGLETVAPLEGHAEGVTSVAFSSDGRRVVSGSWDKTVRIWDAETGLETGVPLEGHSDAVNSVAFSSDGRRVVSGSWDATMRIWDAEKGLEAVVLLEGHSDAVTSIALSSDNKRVVSGSLDQTVRIWDAQTGLEAVAPLTGHSNPVSSIAFSSDGRRVVSGSWDQTVRIWDAVTRLETVVPLEGHSTSESVNFVSLSLDGRRVMSGPDSSIARILDSITTNLLEQPLATGRHEYVPLSAPPFYGVLHLNPLNSCLEDRHGNLLLHIPSFLLGRIVSPRTSCIISRDPQIEIHINPGLILDGTNWASCYAPSLSM